MSLPEKELELLRSEIQQLSSSITRIALLRLSLLALLVFAFANAFTRISESDIGNKINEIEKLESLTNESAWSLEVYPSKDFYLLREWLVRPTESYHTADEESFKFARETLAKYQQKDRSAGNQEAGRIDTSKEKPEQSIEPAPQTSESESDEGRELKEAAEREKRFAEEKNEATELQKRLALDVRKTHSEIFSPEYSLFGAKLKLDLRNWFALLPFLLIVSEVYIYILRKERRLLRLAATHRIHSNQSDQSKIQTLDKLLFADQSGDETPYVRYPARLSETIYLVFSFGLLLYLTVAAKPVWQYLIWQHFIIMAIPLLTAIFYAVAYALHVSAKLEAQFASDIGVTVPPSKFVVFWQRIKERSRRIAASRRPRAWLTTGSVFILVTLFMAVSVDTCGKAKRGHELVFNPVQVSYLREGDTLTSNISEDENNDVWWFPALFNLYRIDSNPRYQSRTAINIAILNQHIGRVAYISSLVLAVITISLLLLSYSRFSPLKVKWLVGFLYFASGGIWLFFVSDIYFTFYMPYLKFALMVVYWLVPVTLWALLGFSRKRKKQDWWARWKLLILTITAPVVVLSILVPVTSLSDTESALYGVFILLLGAPILCLGYMQLYKH